MIQKLISKFKGKTEVDVDSILKQITDIAGKTRIINLCALPTGYSWLGVYNAGLSLFPENTVGIPQYYSNQVLTDNQLLKLGKEIGNLKFDQIIFNGYNTYFSILAKKALEINPSLRIGLIYHGFFAELSGNPTQNNIMSTIIEEIRAKRIHKIGFLKQGNAEIFHKIFGIKGHLLLNHNPEPIDSVDIEPIIGVLTNESFRKNTPTQVIAALSLNQYQVSIFKTDEYDAFDIHSKLIKNEPMSHADFLKNLARNTVNSHVTFSEASGGQVFTESLALGVPCLTSSTHGYLNDSEELTKALIVPQFDDAWSIAQKMEEIISNRDHLSKVGLSYSKQMNQKADELLHKFLEA